MSELEIYGRDGQLVRTIALTPDAHDASKWHLAVPLMLGVHETAQITIDGQPSMPLGEVPPSRAINTLFHTPIPAALDADDPRDEPLTPG